MEDDLRRALDKASTKQSWADAIKILVTRFDESSGDDTLSRRQEKLALLRHLRDETNSKVIYDRCVALVGEQ